MTSFRLNAGFDAVVCAYQGVNHLLSFPAWESFFGCVYEHLNAGGMFVFDIATVGHLMSMASLEKIVEQFDDNYLLITVSTVDGAVFRWQIEVFELQPDGRYGCSPRPSRCHRFPSTRSERRCAVASPASKSSAVMAVQPTARARAGSG